MTPDFSSLAAAWDTPQQSHVTATMKFIPEQLACEAIRESRALHDGAARRGFTTHERSGSDHAFVANDGNLRGGAHRVAVVRFRGPVYRHHRLAELASDELRLRGS